MATEKRIGFLAKNDAQLCDKPDDRLPDAGEVRIQMAYTAVSAGTERAALTANEDGDETCRFGFPMYLGYSGSGVITHVGEGVDEYQVGDRVMVHGGGHGSCCTVPLREIVKLPDNVSLQDAAFVIIAGFSLAAVRKAKVELGHTVLVAGLGLLGLYAVQYLKLSGALHVIASDFDPERRALAAKLGADVVLDPADSHWAEQVKAVAPAGVDSVIEVTGNDKALIDCLHVTKKFGRVILLGCTRKLTHIDFYHDVHVPGIELVGAHSGARPTKESHPGYWTEMDDCRVTLAYLAEGRLDFDSMIHEIHAPPEAHEVYARLARRELPIGVLFDWSKLQ